jgi:hypothetical protein
MRLKHLEEIIYEIKKTFFEPILGNTSKKDIELKSYVCDVCDWKEKNVQCWAGGGGGGKG